MISLKGVSKSFRTKSGWVRALQEVDLTVEAGEFFVLLGPSGSGKTTLLRCVAGLEKPDSGEIGVGPRLMFSANEHLFVPPEERELGMVFQSYAIWPHLTVFKNVALPLTQSKRRLARALVQERVGQALRLVELEQLGDRPAPFLSGGQQQRVALARALAINPKALLMDEPLSNLDARLREEVRLKIKAVVRSLGITVLHVTHDQVEAMVLADRIAVMADGRILQIGSPDELYSKPTNPRVAEFFGSINWIKGHSTGNGWVDTEIGKIPVKGGSAGPVLLGIRPESVKIAVETAANSLEAEVISKTSLGDQIILELRIRGKTLAVKRDAEQEVRGGRVQVYFPKDKIIVFPDAMGA